MTPIEIVIARYGYEILTGTTVTDLTGKNIVAVVVRSAGATLAKLEQGSVNILTERPGLDGALDSQDAPICAGYDIGERSTEFFTVCHAECKFILICYGCPNLKRAFDTTPYFCFNGYTKTRFKFGSCLYFSPRI